MTQVPDVTFKFYRDGELVDVTSEDLFGGKRVVLFSTPSPFAQTRAYFQMPEFNLKHAFFKDQGIDEIYCIAVYDCYVMNACAKDQNITSLVMIPDANGEFTEGMGMLVNKGIPPFTSQSWRYAAVINDGEVEWFVEEAGRRDNSSEDPYVETTPDKVLEYVTNNVVAVA